MSLRLRDDDAELSESRAAPHLPVDRSARDEHREAQRERVLQRFGT
jgi:hypothetical protein